MKLESVTEVKIELEQTPDVPTNRVGGGLTAPVLSHHRTYLRIRRFQ